MANDRCQLKLCCCVSGEVQRVKMRISDPVMSACFHVSQRFFKTIRLMSRVSVVQ